MAFLNAKNICIRRPESTALHFPDLTINSNDKILLLGPSGCGKTTLLSVLAGLLKPTEGIVEIDGQNFYALSSRKRDQLRGKTFGFVFQTLHLLSSLTLRQNIALAPDMAGIKMPDQKLNSIISTLGLTEKAHRRPEALSQGEMQRAAIARAVIHAPKIIVADEPTSALDDSNAQIVIDLLEQQARENSAALLIATHDNRIASRFTNVVNLAEPVRKAA